MTARRINSTADAIIGFILGGVGMGIVALGVGMMAGLVTVGYRLVTQ